MRIWIAIVNDDFIIYNVIIKCISYALRICVRDFNAHTCARQCLLQSTNRKTFYFSDFLEFDANRGRKSRYRKALRRPSSLIQGTDWRLIRSNNRNTTPVYFLGASQYCWLRRNLAVENSSVLKLLYFVYREDYINYTIRRDLWKIIKDQVEILVCIAVESSAIREPRGWIRRPRITQRNLS